MARIDEKPLLGKVIIGGKITCMTGLHIGVAKESLEIGGIDAPVLRDPITREPYIPGSSLKGKMRALLERRFNSSGNGKGKPKVEFNRDIGTSKNPIRIHNCDDSEKAQSCPICRIFGSTGANGGGNFPARIAVRDARLTSTSEADLKKIETGLQYTEWKFENSLDRITAASNPRQLERVPSGAEFEFEIVYNVETSNNREVNEDLNNLLETMNLLQDDYLGGHGSRGYGKVKFNIETFLARRIDYYGAATDEEREKTSERAILEEETIAECKAKMEDVLSIFK